MNRILIDTNAFVAAAYNPESASRKIVRAVERGELKLIVSPEIVREYKAILPKAVRSGEARDWLWQVIEMAERVTLAENPPVTEDRADDKFLAAAVAGVADAIVSSDQHLLDVHPYAGIDILRPTEFWDRFSTDSDESGPSGPV
ncbi:MAG: putative toxin-antitoxin system toxin component, PIN family [Pirellulaceae bacterium]